MEQQLDAKEVDVPQGNEGARHYVSPDTAGELFGVTGRTIRNMIRRGDITGYRLGPRLIRVDLAELEDRLRIIPTGRDSAA